MTAGPGDQRNADGGRGPRGLSCLLLAFVSSLVVGLGVLILVAGFVVPPTCFCASTPTPDAGGPTPTPWPISGRQASANALSFTGLSMPATENGFGEPMYALTDGTTYAFVDGWSGSVLEVFTLDRMPDPAAGGGDLDAALAAALSYLERAGMDLSGMTIVSQLRHVVSASFYAVVWTQADGTLRHEVLVNPASGSVFAYSDLGFSPKHGLGVPVIGASTATTLAQASPYSAGETASYPPEFLLYGGDGNAAGSWMVGFNDGVLSVDPVTGDVAVMKWSPSR